MNWINWNPSPRSRFTPYLRGSIAVVLCFFVSTAFSANECPKWAGENEICPIPAEFADVWRKFYFEGTGEAHLVGILVSAGPEIIPSALEVISNENMFARIYAITALGFLKDSSAICGLRSILNDNAENQYIRSAALKALYVIDPGAGQTDASRVINESYGEDGRLIETARIVVNDPERIPQEWKRH